MRAIAWTRLWTRRLKKAEGDQRRKTKRRNPQEHLLLVDIPTVEGPRPPERRPGPTDRVDEDGRSQKAKFTGPSPEHWKRVTLRLKQVEGFRNVDPPSTRPT